MIFTSDLFLFEKNDYYIYSFKQLVSMYRNFRNMLDHLILLLSEREEDSSKSSISNSNFLKLLKYINSHYNQDISLTGTAAILNMNPNYLSQMFKKETGVTFTHYITDLRISEAKRQLCTTEASISDIAMNVGFNDYFYFLKTFKKITGKTPSQWRMEM